jgi:hypothetical protein
MLETHSCLCKQQRRLAALRQWILMKTIEQRDEKWHPASLFKKMNACQRNCSQNRRKCVHSNNWVQCTVFRLMLKGQLNLHNQSCTASSSSRRRWDSLGASSALGLSKATCKMSPGRYRDATKYAAAATRPTNMLPDKAYIRLLSSPRP